jgi:hypothetical protein
MKQIVGNGIDFRSLNCTSRVHGPSAPGVGDTQPREPIHVQVRVRQYADTLPELWRAGANSPNPGRLPVGTILDCYV